MSRRGEPIATRVSGGERARMERAAARTGLSLGTWMRAVLLAAAGGTGATKALDGAVARARKAGAS